MPQNTEQELSSVDEKIQALQKQISPIVNEIKQLNEKRAELINQSKLDKYKDLLPLSIEKVATTDYTILQANQDTYREVKDFVNKTDGLSYSGGYNPTTNKIAISINYRKKLNNQAISNIKQLFSALDYQSTDSVLKLKQLFQDKYKQFKMVQVSEKTCGEYGIFKLVQTENGDTFLIKIIYGSYKLLAKVDMEKLQEELGKFCE